MSTPTQAIQDLANAIALQAEAVANGTATSLRGAASLIASNGEHLLTLVKASEEALEEDYTSPAFPGGDHSHRYQGSKLVHSHPGGEQPHGYYEHPEDGNR